MATSVTLFLSFKSYPDESVSLPAKVKVTQKLRFATICVVVGDIIHGPQSEVRVPLPPYEKKKLCCREFFSKKIYHRYYCCYYVSNDGTSTSSGAPTNLWKIMNNMAKRIVQPAFNPHVSPLVSDPLPFCYFPRFRTSKPPTN